MPGSRFSARVACARKTGKERHAQADIGDLAFSIEGGSTFSEAWPNIPRSSNRLYVNMVKAGEIGGVLEVVLSRLADFMEKAQKIKGKVVAAMFLSMRPS